MTQNTSRNPYEKIKINHGQKMSLSKRVLCCHNDEAVEIKQVQSK
jgi:hypothetical protein